MDHVVEVTQAKSMSCIIESAIMTGINVNDKF